jgi:acetyl-CoA C-acetyltransferase
VIHDVLDGVFDRGGALPIGIDGGLKCFGTRSAPRACA